MSPSQHGWRTAASIWCVTVICVAGCGQATQQDGAAQMPMAAHTSETPSPLPSSSEPALTEAARSTVTELEVDTADHVRPELEGVEEVLGFHIGGDNLCHGVDQTSGPMLDQVREGHDGEWVQSLAARDVVEIGWYSTFCTGTSAPATVEVTSPDGDTERREIDDRFELTLGARDPVGTYTVEVTADGRSAERQIEVRHATRPIVRAGRLAGRIDGASSGSTEGQGELSLLGFARDSDVHVGFYVQDATGSNPQLGSLVDVPSLRTDAFGQAVAEVSLDTGPGSCAEVIAGVDDIATGRPDDLFDLDGVTYINFIHPRHESVCQ